MADKPADAELTDIDQIEMSLTVAPAVQEDILMTKSEEKKKAAIEKANADLETAKAALKKAEDDEEEDEEETPDPKPEEDEEDEDKNFNFEKIGDEAKEVISAIGKALMGLVDGGQAEGLPEGVQDFAKAAAALAPISKSAKQEKDVLAIAKSLLGDGAVAAIQAPVRAELSTLTSKVNDMEEEKDLEDMKKTAAELPGGETPEGALVVAKRLTMIKKSMSAKDFESYVEDQKGVKAQIEKSELFRQQSSSRSTPVEGSAEARIYAKAETMVSKGEGGVKTLDEAISAVAKKEPDLWGEYQEETRARVRVQGGN